MVDSSPLPLALVDRQGRVQQLNQAGCRLFGIATESQALGIHLEALGLSPSEISLHLVRARAPALQAAARRRPGGARRRWATAPAPRGGCPAPATRSRSRTAGTRPG